MNEILEIHNDDELEELTRPETEAVPEVQATPKKKRSKPVAKKRDITDLYSVEPHRMSPEEMKLVIKTLREENTNMSRELQGVDIACKGAFERARLAEMALQAVKVDASKKINYLVSAIGNLNTSVNLLIKEDK